MHDTRISRTLAAILAGAVLVVEPQSVEAITTAWIGTVGDWSAIPSNWDKGLPTSTDIASIDNGGAAIVTRIGETCQYLYLGGSGTGAVQMEGGNLDASYCYIGNSGAGTFNLSGDALLSAVYEFIGYSSTGTFTQSAGTNTVSQGPFLAYFPAAVGTYELNGGRLVTSALAQGAGTASFNFAGGTLNAAADFATSVPMTSSGSGGATIDTGSFNVTVSGSLTGDGGLTKGGTGVLTLLGTSSYGGDTVVGAGALRAMVLSGTGNTSVQGGAILQVNSLRQHQLTIAAGGTVILGGVSAPTGAAGSYTPTLAGLAEPNTVRQAGSGSVGRAQPYTTRPADLDAESSSAIPEPSTLTLLAAAAAAELWYRRYCRTRAWRGTFSQPVAGGSGTPCLTRKSRGQDRDPGWRFAASPLRLPWAIVRDAFSVKVAKHWSMAGVHLCITTRRKRLG